MVEKIYIRNCSYDFGFFYVENFSFTGKWRVFDDGGCSFEVLLGKSQERTWVEKFLWKETITTRWIDSNDFVFVEEPEYIEMECTNDRV